MTDLIELKSHRPVSVYLARSIANRFYKGRIIVVTDRPKIACASFAKQWKKQILIQKTEISKTLERDQILFHQTNLHRIAALNFSSVRSGLNEKQADILFIHPSEATALTIECSILFISSEITEDEQEALFIALSPKHEIIILNNT